MTVTWRHEFLEPGPHVVEASIDPDGLDLDDRRWLALDVKPGIQVLIVDGEPENPPEHSDADYLKLLLTHSPYNVSGPVTTEMFTGDDLARPRGWPPAEHDPGARDSRSPPGGMNGGIERRHLIRLLLWQE